MLLSCWVGHNNAEAKLLGVLAAFEVTMERRDLKHPTVGLKCGHIMWSPSEAICQRQKKNMQKRHNDHARSFTGGSAVCLGRGDAVGRESASSNLLRPRPMIILCLTMQFCHSAVCAFCILQIKPWETHIRCKWSRTSRDAASSAILFSLGTASAHRAASYVFSYVLLHWASCKFRTATSRISPESGFSATADRKSVV